MSRKTKIWLVIAALFVLIGGLIFAGVMNMLKWDFTKLSTSKYETNSYEIGENYKDISILTETADIEFLLSENEKTSVVCREEASAKHAVGVKEGKLTIEVNDTRKWYEHIGINFSFPKITVYLPQKEYGALNVKGSTSGVSLSEELRFKSVDIAVSTGDITLENTSAEDVEISVSTGKTSAVNLNCTSFTSKGSTGDVYLKNVIATDKLSLKRNTGNITLEKCDAAEITIKNDTGYVKGSLLSEKVFTASASTGKVDVPKTTSGGKCEITTSTGDIKITIE